LAWFSQVHNEAAYLNASSRPSGNQQLDHQARICHSTTSPGSPYLGYGAMTNSYNDIRNAKTILQMGAIPRRRIRSRFSTSLKQGTQPRQHDRCRSRMTRTAAHATEYFACSGTHIATIYGMLWHIFRERLEDKEFLRQRVYGVDEIRKQVAKWTPHEVERVTGLPKRRSSISPKSSPRKSPRR